MLFIVIMNKITAMLISPFILIPMFFTVLTLSASPHDYSNTDLHIIPFIHPCEIHADVVYDAKMMHNKGDSKSKIIHTLTTEYKIYLGTYINYSAFIILIELAVNLDETPNALSMNIGRACRKYFDKAQFIQTTD